MPQDFTDDKSTLAQVTTWCRQATSHYLGQCWPRSVSPYGVARPQWVNTLRIWCSVHNLSIVPIINGVFFGNNFPFPMSIYRRSLTFTSPMQWWRNPPNRALIISKLCQICGSINEACLYASTGYKNAMLNAYWCMPRGVILENRSANIDINMLITLNVTCLGVLNHRQITVCETSCLG